MTCINANTAITYRALPSELTEREIVHHLNYLGDAVGWAGELGDYARARAADLRAELRRRKVRS